MDPEKKGEQAWKNGEEMAMKIELPYFLSWKMVEMEMMEMEMVEMAEMEMGYGRWWRWKW